MSTSRRDFLRSTALLPQVARSQGRTTVRPNVLMILTDDQGYGDLGCHGNPWLKTPNIDRLHSQSVRFTDFHVSPMCAPTRSQLLTGTDCVRNGAMATCAGRSIPREGLPMIPEAFAASGYRTGIFGKWHLGYSYPYRPMDRGFQECVYFNGFGLTGMGHHWGSDYFDPFYYHNGALKQASGFCTDFWFDRAMAWMGDAQRRHDPFFCYLPVNAPHFPMWVDPRYSKPYEKTRDPGFYGLIANLDENMGRLEAFLRGSGLRENTLVVFLTDNGTVVYQDYNAGVRGWKTRLEEGGHRVPSFWRWPAGKLRPAGDIAVNCHVQDVFPTLVELCGLRKPQAAFDGVSLASLLRGLGEPADRMMVVQFYQTSIRKYNATVMWGKWRLVRNEELYDIHSDPGQKSNLAPAHGEVVARMREHYERWWSNIEPTLSDYVPAHIGSTHQPEVPLCSSEWEEVRADGQASARLAAGGSRGGPWNILVERAGDYTIELRRWPREVDAALNAGIPAFQPRYGTPEPAGKALPVAGAVLVHDGREQRIATTASDKAAIFRLALKPGKTKLHGWFQDAAGNDLCGAYFAYVRH
jgi:arylsulfatase